MAEEEASLRLAIDATRAKDGALQFSISADQVKKAAEGATNAQDGMNKSGEGLGNQLVALGKKLAVMAAAYVGVRASIKAAAEAQSSMEALSAAVGLQDDARRKALDGLKEFSKEMQKLTIYGDDEIQSEMAYAKNLGVTTNELEKATMAAMGLATKYRIDLSSAMMLVGRAHEGQTQMMARYGIVLDDTLTKQEKYNKVIEIGINSFSLVTSKINTATGSWKQIKNELNDVAEAIGQIALPLIKETKPGIVTFLESIRKPLEELDIEKMERAIAAEASYKRKVREAGAQNDVNRALALMGQGPAQSVNLDLTSDEALYAREQALRENQRIKAMFAAKKAGQAIAPEEGPTPLSPTEIKAQTETTLKLYQDMYSNLDSTTMTFYGNVRDYDEQYYQAFKARLDLQYEEYKTNKVDENTLDAWYSNQLIAFNKKIAEEDKELVSQRAEITSRMYEDMGEYGTGYYEAQKKMLDLQYADYAKFIKDKALLDEWYKNQLEKLQTENSYVWGQMKTVVQDTKGALAEFFMTFENGEDVLTAFGKSVQKMFANIAAEIAMYQGLQMLGITPGTMGVQNPLGGPNPSSQQQVGGGAQGGTGIWGQLLSGVGNYAQSFWNAMFTPQMNYVNTDFVGPPAPVTTAHSGWLVGISSAFTKMVDSSAFANAIRLHSGTSDLAKGEYRAILQEGERVQSRAEVAKEQSKSGRQERQNVNIRVINVEDSDAIPRAMAGAKGEKIIINHLRNVGVL